MRDDALKTKPLDMDDPEEGQESGEQPKTERINGQHLRVGVLADFVSEVLGIELSPGVLKAPIRVMLGVEKFRTHGHRRYRLVWVGNRQAWLAAENTTSFRRYREAVEAGTRIAEETGAYFDERTR